MTQTHSSSNNTFLLEWYEILPNNDIVWKGVERIRRNPRQGLLFEEESDFEMESLDQ